MTQHFVASSGAKSLSHFRVVLAELPPLLEGILLEAFSHALDMEVMAVAASRADLAGCLHRASPDILVIGAADTHAASVASEFRRTHPALIVLAIAPTGERAVLFGRGATPTVLRDASATGMLTAIRDS